MGNKKQKQTEFIIEVQSEMSKRYFTGMHGNGELWRMSKHKTNAERYETFKDAMQQIYKLKKGVNYKFIVLPIKSN